MHMVNKYQNITAVQEENKFKNNVVMKFASNKNSAPGRELRRMYRPTRTNQTKPTKITHTMNRPTLAAQKSSMSWEYRTERSEKGWWGGGGVVRKENGQRQLFGRNTMGNTEEKKNRRCFVVCPFIIVHSSSFIHRRSFIVVPHSRTPHNPCLPLNSNMAVFIGPLNPAAPIVRSV